MQAPGRSWPLWRSWGELHLLPCGSSADRPEHLTPYQGLSLAERAEDDGSYKARPAERAQGPSLTQPVLMA